MIRISECLCSGIAMPYMYGYIVFICLLHSTYVLGEALCYLSPLSGKLVGLAANDLFSFKGE